MRACKVSDTLTSNAVPLAAFSDLRQIECRLCEADANSTLRFRHKPHTDGHAK